MRVCIYVPVCVYVCMHVCRPSPCNLTLQSHPAISPSTTPHLSALTSQLSPLTSHLHTSHLTLHPHLSHLTPLTRSSCSDRIEGDCIDSLSAILTGAYALGEVIGPLAGSTLTALFGFSWATTVLAITISGCVANPNPNPNPNLDPDPDP